MPRESTLALSAFTFFLGLVPSASAQTGQALDGRLESRPVEKARPLVPVVLEGIVLDLRGAPASGAVVTSSAGGRAVTDGDGRYRLELEAPLEAESVLVTAVLGAGADLVASSSTGLRTTSGFASVDPLWLEPLACSPSWTPTFGEAPGFDNGAGAFIVFDDGNGPALYVGGSFTTAGGVAATHIARWDGSSWSALGPENLGPAPVGALAVFDDGSGPALFVGGSFASAGGVAANNIAKWNGTNWSALGSGIGGTGGVYSVGVSALAVFDDGSGSALYAGGTFTTAGGVAASHIARWNGTSWSAVGGGLDDAVWALTVFDSELYAGGSFTAAGGTSANRIARWDGTGWSALGTGMNHVVSALTVFDSALLAGGVFTTAGGVAANRIARWDGASWSTLGTGFGGGYFSNGAVYALAAFGSVLHAAGSFTTAGGGAASRIARWDGASWSALGSGLDGGLSSNVSAYALTEFGSALYVVGTFGTAGGADASYIAKWDGASWSGLGTGPSATVRALAAFDDGSGSNLYAGGDFTRAGGVPVSRIAKWDGTSWSALGSGVSTPGADSRVRALTVFDDGSGTALYAGGDFWTAGGMPANFIARWNGANWSAVGSGTNATVMALAVHDDGNGPALYAGGNFTYAGGVPESHIAKWDGSSWSALGSGLNGLVTALAVFDSELYAAGTFTSAGGVPANRIARWNGSHWSALDTGLNGAVMSLTVLDDRSLTVLHGGTANWFTKGRGPRTGSSERGPALFACGAFSRAGGVRAKAVAKWDGSNWFALGSGINGSADVMTVFDDGSGPALYAGGSFDVAGGVSARYVARWSGSSWSALGSGLTGEVFALTAFDDGSGPALVAGGAFRTSPAGDSFVARWSGCP